MSDVVDASARPPPATFTAAENLILDEAREGYKREDALNTTYQAKTTLFLAFSGFFSALIGAGLNQLLGDWSGGPLQWITLALLGSCLLTLLGTAGMLIEASLRDYQSIADPGAWREHLEKVWAALDASGHTRDGAEPILQKDLLDAWAQATRACGAANRGKRQLLGYARNALRCALVLAALGLMTFTAQAITEVKMAESKEPTSGEASPPANAPEAKPAALVLPERPANQTEARGAEGPKERS